MLFNLLTLITIASTLVLAQPISENQIQTRSTGNSIHSQYKRAGDLVSSITCSIVGFGIFTPCSPNCIAPAIFNSATNTCLGALDGTAGTVVSGGSGILGNSQGAGILGQGNQGSILGGQGGI